MPESSQTRPTAVRYLGAIALAFALVAASGCVNQPGEISAPKAAENGYDLWLRYVRVDDPALLRADREAMRQVIVEGDSPTLRAIRAELRTGLSGLLGEEIPVSPQPTGAGAVIVGTPRTSPIIAGLGLDSILTALGPEGYLIRSMPVDDVPATVVASQGEVGALYGAFALLRRIQTYRPVADLDESSRPRLALRLLDHWDNLDGSIERGYAGPSIWKWDDLPDSVGRRIIDYARANASIGINGAVLNNVNADPRILRSDYLPKVAALADALRPYGIRVYLSANFGAPLPPSATPDELKEGGGIGDLDTADPLDPAVRHWWKAKADEIYRLIPDFGGFLVKANSEGMPGPGDYGRSHADGANMLAEAVAPHGGIVIWRAFVYPEKADPDRAKRAYEEFTPFDGEFADNALVQVKNGPLDFQPHEPFHPLFGAMPNTALMLELQITQEYLGHSTALVYLAPMWKETLTADTYEQGPGSTVAREIDGSLTGHPGGIAGVANIGSDENWTGHPFAAANWYAFGRLAWNPDLSAADIAEEWTRMTWGNSPRVVNTITSMMRESWPAAVNYMTPLGLNLVVEGGDHYLPDPAKREGSYWFADSVQIGYDRTTSGSDYVSQYHSPLRERWNNPRTTPLEDLLWFHELPWNYELSTGRTLWDELAYRFYEGAAYVDSMRAEWDSLQDDVDPERFATVQKLLDDQAAYARLWRDTAVRFFQCRSELPLPADAVALAAPGDTAAARIEPDCGGSDGGKGWEKGTGYRLHGTAPVIPANAGIQGDPLGCGPGGCRDCLVNNREEANGRIEYP